MASSRIPVLTLLLAAVLVAAPGAAPSAAAPAAAPQDDEFRWSGALSAGQQLEIKNLNGAIHAEAATGNQVEIVVEKEGRDADAVTVEVVEHAGGVTVCSVYPSRSEPNVCAPGDDARLSNDDNTKANLTFRVRVPAGVKLDANTMNGAIEAKGISAELRANTMNGAIDASTTGWAALKSMNGAIDVSMQSTDWNGTLELETMNGSIEVMLPADASTEIQASTMNGKVSSDWSLSYSDERRRNRAHGQIGAGGRELSLKTMNGGIRIRRAS